MSTGIHTKSTCLKFSFKFKDDDESSIYHVSGRFKSKRGDALKRIMDNVQVVIQKQPWFYLPYLTILHWKWNGHRTVTVLERIVEKTDTIISNTGEGSTVKIKFGQARYLILLDNIFDT